MKYANGQCFNPLAGIRCFLTEPLSTASASSTLSFNPLAGIRCFLTCVWLLDDGTYAVEFQSPCGDSLFSDTVGCHCDYAGQIRSFNPLAGIRCFLTGYA